MNKKKHYIFINQVTGPLFIDILNAFVEKNYSVTLYTGKIEKTYAELDPNVHVRKLVSYKRDKILYRLTTWVLFFLQAMILLPFDSKKNSKLFLVSNPPLAPFLGLFSRKQFDVLIYDIYPDILKSNKILSESNWIYKLFRRLNIYTYSKAEFIFTIGEGMKEILSKYSDKGKIEVVPCWTDTSFIKPIPRSENWFLKKHGWGEKIIILYSGNMGATHDFETILKVAKQLWERQNYKFHFVFIGDGVQTESLKNYARDHQLQNVTFLPFQEKDTLPYSLSCADFGLVTQGVGAESLSVPSKTFYQLAAGNAILAVTGKDSELAHIVNDYNSGAVFEPGEYDRLSNFLEKINPVSISQLKENARNASDYFSKKNAYKFLKD